MDNNGPFIQFAESISTSSDPLLVNSLRFKGDLGTAIPNDIMKISADGRIFTGVDPFNNYFGLPPLPPPSINYNLFVSGKQNNGDPTGIGLYVRPSKAAGRQVGIYAEAFGSVANNTIGIYSGVVNPGQFDYAASFNGDVLINGVNIGSDKRLKKDIKQENNAIEKIMKLNPVSYKYDKNASKWLNFEFSKTSHGFIADEVLEVFPEMVKEFVEPVLGDAKALNEAKVFKSVNYIQLISILTKGIQEQQAQIEELKTLLKSTNTLVLNDNLKLPQDIANKAFTLSQNTPNPFSEKTTITYSIPTNTEKAVLAIFDMTGKLLQQYNLLQGKNQLVINGNTLQAGMYIYSLLANGQEVVSKRMVLTK